MMIEVTEIGQKSLGPSGLLILGTGVIDAVLRALGIYPRWRLALKKLVREGGKREILIWVE